MINDRVSPPYYAELRLPMLSLVTGHPQRVLEIGCGGGQTLSYLKERGAEFAAGVECCANVAEHARQHCDCVIVGDIETTELEFAPESFDLLIAGHVLEHLTDPWKSLRKLRMLLRPHGQLVGALPNVRHHSVIFPLLLRGKWEYQASGIMDWTHMRFFSRATVLELLASSGFRLQRIEPEFHKKSLLASRLTLHVFEDLFSYAYNFSAVKSEN